MSNTLEAAFFYAKQLCTNGKDRVQPRYVIRRKFIAFFTMILTGIAFGLPAPATQPNHVTFRADGIALVNGKPFFPLGIWLYSLDKNVMADIHEHRFNTVIGSGSNSDQIGMIADNGLMAVPVYSEDFFKSAWNSPALLAWYLSDEPEGHNKTPKQLRQDYLALKSRDPNHPIGLDHYLWQALTKYQDCCDFTMTDVYPILANRDGTIDNVGKFVDEAHRIHGPGWPHWCFIQDFGGKDTDNGKWAQPLPFEVRCMTFIALAHRATGIMYFSYWPQAPETWASISSLNRNLERIIPWLAAKGVELPAKSDRWIDVRVKKVGDGYMIIAVNHDQKPHDSAIHMQDVPDQEFTVPYEARTIHSHGGILKDHFDPFAEHVYLAGAEPADVP